MSRVKMLFCVLTMVAVLGVLTTSEAQAGWWVKKWFRHPDAAALEAKITQLEAQLVAIQNQIGQQADYGQKIANLEAALAAANSTIDTLQTQATQLQTQIAALQEAGSTLPANLQELAKYVQVDPNELEGVKGPHIIFEGVNVHIRSGSGYTDDNEAPTGLGNLIIGYDEAYYAEQPGDRWGSHNLVIGSEHRFSSYAGFVAGKTNTIESPYGSILGGRENAVRGDSCTVAGGMNNVAEGFVAVLP
jgi:uncharacterized coiled-coil protein SlyX